MILLASSCRRGWGPRDWCLGGRWPAAGSSSGKSLRISRTSAPTPLAISAPVASPALWVPIMSMTTLGLWPWVSPFCRPRGMPWVVSPETPKLATFCRRIFLEDALAARFPARSCPVHKSVMESPETGRRNRRFWRFPRSPCRRARIPGAGRMQDCRAASEPRSAGHISRTASLSRDSLDEPLEVGVHLGDFRGGGTRHGDLRRYGSRGSRRDEGTPRRAPSRPPPDPPRRGPASPGFRCAAPPGGAPFVRRGRTRLSAHTRGGDAQDDDREQREDRPDMHPDAPSVARARPDGCPDCRTGGTQIPARVRTAGLIVPSSLSLDLQVVQEVAADLDRLQRGPLGGVLLDVVAPHARLPARPRTPCASRSSRGRPPRTGRPGRSGSRVRGRPSRP